MFRLASGARGLVVVQRRLASSSVVTENKFKTQITGAGRKQIGLWTGLGNSLVAEMLSHVSGFDWLVIDMEHSPNDVTEVLHQLQASQHGNAEPVVRVPWNEPVMVKRVLDLGARSVIFPMVNTKEEAELAVSAMRYPPKGVRGVMSLQRMNMYGAQAPHYYKEIEQQLCTIVQIETAEAVKNIPAIASVDGVDALFVGPSDLSASIGHLGNPGHPEVRKLIEEAFAAIKASGKAAGYLSANHDDCRWVLDMGADFVAVGSDIALLTNLCRKHAADFHTYCEKFGSS
eukprot:Hpha_TRINITY_DN16332_c1_g1::TRINITY_DN16332_c1_g1_i1::g.60862::m.60862/K02510/hpaI, hpcH; 4-hydroxy-2-oxoheptanedioate aldolase